MAYGHAQRVLDAIGRLEDETRDLLSGLDHLDAEQAEWLADFRAAARQAGRRVSTSGAWKGARDATGVAVALAG